MVDSRQRVTFDIETYPAAFIICGLVNGETWEEYVVCPSVEGYQSTVDCNVVKGWMDSLKGKGWSVTYNGKGFDLRVLTWIATCGKRTLTPEEISDAASKLIADNNVKSGPRPKTSPCWSVKFSDMAKYRRQHFDVLKCRTLNHSLKWWELMRGWSVKESSVSFDAKTMTREELLESIRYCRHDVKCTDMLYMEKDCQELIAARQWVIDNAPCYIFPDATSAELAETYCYGDADVIDESESCFELVPWDEFNVPADFKLQMQQIARHEIDGFNWNGIDYGAGGAHFAAPGRHKGTKIFDVASLYPHIIEFFTKLKTKDALKRYVGCLAKRLENKRKKGTPEYSKSADKGLKLVLNSLSGKFGQRGAKAYAPEHRLAMCIIGQMLITEAACNACGDDFSNLVEINTDSFAVKGDEQIARAREYCNGTPHGFMFEEDDFADSYWKDVNHYFVYDTKGGLNLQEVHGDVNTDLKEYKNETILIESLAINLREPEGTEPHLAEFGNCNPELKADNCVVKWVKGKGIKNASIDGEPMRFKHYYFLWTTPDCPDSHVIRFNASKVADNGTISVRHGVYTFDGVDALRKYEQWIDPDQYVEDLKSELATWGRADMFTPMSRRAVPEHCTSFHEIRQCANGFFDMPDDLF